MSVKFKSLAFLGYPKYRVGDDGSVWTYRMNREGIYRWKIRILSTLRKKPYKRICLGKKMFLVHRLVLLAFVGPCPVGMEGCHFDNDATNNRLSNLRWDTLSNNQKDRVRLRSGSF